MYNYKTTPDVLPVFIEKKNVELFKKHHIFTETEIQSRYEILLENYTKTLRIEARTLVDMVTKQFLPALADTIDRSVTLANKKKELSEKISVKADKAIVEKLSKSYDAVYDKVTKLAADIVKADKITDELKLAKYYEGEILKEMSAIREVADEAEVLIPKDILPYPSYADMLFYV